MKRRGHETEIVNVKGLVKGWGVLSHILFFQLNWSEKKAEAQ